MIFESHAHYDDEAFDADRDTLLQSLPENQIEAVINVGANIDTCRKTIELTQRYSFVYGALGVHPSDTDELDETKFTWLEEQLNLPKIQAVGEIGLDYYWPEPSHDIQKEWFERQLILAKRYGKPVIIHSRDAAKDTLDMMKNVHAGSTGCVIHCFSYGKDMAREFLELDYYFGIGGVITFQNAKKLKEAVEYIPIDKILLETDCPYLAPVPNRGKRNSSLNLTYIAQAIAEIKGITASEVIGTTNLNAKRLFFGKESYGGIRKSQ